MIKVETREETVRTYVTRMIVCITCMHVVCMCVGAVSRETQLFAELIGQIEGRKKNIRELLADGNEFVKAHHAILVEI